MHIILILNRWDEDVCAQDRSLGNELGTQADTCNGDSGGPMTVQENFRHVVVSKQCVV